MFMPVIAAANGPVANAVWPVTMPHSIEVISA
jgi:hypothetical protein